MSPNAALLQDWMSALPPLRGKLLPDVALADLCWFRVGGMADLVFMPADEDDLAAFLAALPQEVPVCVLGAGSNTLVRDGGVRGVTIRLGAAFGKATQTGDNEMSAGAATLDVRLARAAAETSLSGLEFYRGIPGAIGGAIAMNAGAYGGETGDVLIEVEAYDRLGQRHVLRVDDLNLAYRHNGFDDWLVYTKARFKAVAGERADIEAAMQAISDKRENSQPIKERTGGSTFKNPGGANPDGPKAWQLIEAAGCRGLSVGDAQMSEHHCNFMINRGAASAADLEKLGEEVKARVHAESGHALHWEIRRIGEAL